MGSENLGTCDLTGTTTGNGIPVYPEHDVPHPPKPACDGWSEQREKLGTCDGTNSPWVHRGLHTKSTLCVNWREQPQGFPIDKTDAWEERQDANRQPQGEPSRCVCGHIKSQHPTNGRRGVCTECRCGEFRVGVPSTLEAGEKRRHIHETQSYDADTCPVCDDVMRRDAERMLLQTCDSEPASPPAHTGVTVREFFKQRHSLHGEEWVRLIDAEAFAEHKVRKALEKRGLK